MNKVQLAELMPTEAAARSQALLALAARKLGREDWAQWLGAARARLLTDAARLMDQRPVLRELWKWDVPGADKDDAHDAQNRIRRRDCGGVGDCGVLDLGIGPRSGIGHAERPARSGNLGRPQRRDGGGGMAQTILLYFVVGGMYPRRSLESLGCASQLPAFSPASAPLHLPWLPAELQTIAPAGRRITGCTCQVCDPLPLAPSQRFFLLGPSVPSPSCAGQS